MVRPERFVDLAAGGAPAPANRIDGSVTESAYIGVSDKYRIATAEGLDVLVRLPSRAEQPALPRGRADRCRASTPPTRA